MHSMSAAAARSEAEGVPGLFAAPSLDSAAVQMIGLTGGIGSGKSTVASLLAARGAVVIDADVIARQVVEPGSPVLAQLAERFGPDIIGPEGRLDRPRLAEKAFVSDETRKELEAITHPAIGEEFLRQVAAAPEGAVVVHDVPLLVESKNPAQYRAVIVVEAPRELRLERLEARGHPASPTPSDGWRSRRPTRRAAWWRPG